MSQIHNQPGKISAAILCKNAGKTLERTLESLSWVDEIIVLDDNSTDNTYAKATKFHAWVIKEHYENFSQKRNALLKHCKTDWIFYVDADEVVPNALRDEILKIISKNEPGAFIVPRSNYFLGKRMYPDQVERLFHKNVLKGWSGAVHESPVISVESKRLRSPLIHHTHTDIRSMLEKTNQWSDIEADLRVQAHHPPVAWWRLIRIALTEGWHQFGGKGLLRFGRAGLFEGYFQIVDKLIVYTKLWERQHQP